MRCAAAVLPVECGYSSSAVFRPTGQRGRQGVTGHERSTEDTSGPPSSGGADEADPSRPAWGRRSRRRTATAIPAPATVTAAVARSGSSTSPSTSPHTAAVMPNTAAVHPTRFFLSVTSAAFAVGSDHQPGHVSSSQHQSTMSEAVPTVSAPSWNGSAQAGSRPASVEHAVTWEVL